MKRIALSESDALHAYEWLRMYWREDDQKFGGCYLCARIGKRLERFIGPASVRGIARLVRDHPTNRTVRTKKKQAKGR